MEFKSKRKANIAMILNYNKIRWEYERDSFSLELKDKNGCSGYYLPDFFLDDDNITHVGVRG